MKVQGIRERLLIATGTLVGLALLIGVFAWSSLARIRGHLTELSAHAEPATILLLNIDRDAYQAQLGLERAIATADPGAREAGVAEFETNAGQVVERFALYQGCALDTEGEALAWGEFEALRREWMRQGEELARGKRAGESVAPEALAAEQVAFSAARERLDLIFAEFYENRLHAISAGVERTTSLAAWSIGGAVLLLSALIAVLAAWMSRVLRPLKGITDAARRIAGGDIGRLADVHAREDEVGVLSQSFVEMSAFLTDVTETLAVVARGDLRNDILVRSENDAIGTAVHTMVEGLRLVVGDLLGAVERVTASSASLGDANRSLDESVELTMEQASSMASATTEMEATIREISLNASRVASAAGEAEHQATGTSEVIARLDQSSGEIGKITEVIRRIADQTNLLALNATIEAARAGDFGKGFAVVADEVKQLAGETSRATEKVRLMVAAIQTDTRTAVAEIGEMASRITSICEFAASVAAAVEQQQATMHEIGRGAVEVVRAADTTRSTSLLTSRAADELQHLAGALNESVGRFRV